MSRLRVLSTCRKAILATLAWALLFVVFPNGAPAVGTYLGELPGEADDDDWGPAIAGAAHALLFHLAGRDAAVADSGLKVFEEYAVVTATNGIVDHTVGTGVNQLGGPLDVSMFVTDNFMYLQVGIDSASNPVLPRTRLGTAPLAAKAFSSADGVPQGFSILSNYPNPPPGFSNTGKPLYNPWLYLKRMVTPRTSLAAAAANGKIYTIGGIASATNRNENEEYDPDTNVWAVKAVLPTPRGELTAVELGGLVYVAGGNDFANHYKLTHSYNPNTNIWTPRANMNVERSRHCMVVSGGKIYVFGGINGTSGTLQSVEEYRTPTQTSDPKAEIPTPPVCRGGCFIWKHSRH